MLDESRYPEGQPDSLVGMLLDIENCRSVEQLQPVIDTIIEQWKALMPSSLRRALVSWVFRVVAPGKNMDINQIDIENLSEVQVMLATRMKQWEQELVEKGIEKGREEGMLTGEAELLRRQLQLRFGTLPAWVNDKLTAATRTELEHWGMKILDARTLDAVFG